MVSCFFDVYTQSLGEIIHGSRVGEIKNAQNEARQIEFKSFSDDDEEET